MLAISDFSGTKNLLCQGAEQGLRQFNQIVVIRIRHVEFHHCELRIMANRNTFITEVTVDFEYPFKTAYNQTFQIQLWRDTQVHI